MKIQLKRSNVLNGDVAKEPTPGQMEYGELAVNYNSTDPAVFLKNSDNTIVRVTGSTYWEVDGENLYPITDGGDLLIGGTLPSNPSITLENSGSATFTGDVTISNADLNAVNGAFSGSVTAVNGTYTGDITAVNGTYSDTVTANNFDFSALPMLP